MSTRPNWILHRDGAPARRQRWTRQHEPQPPTPDALLDRLEAEVFASQPLTRTASRLLSIWD